MVKRLGPAELFMPALLPFWFLSFACIYSAFPQIDLWTSLLFFTPGVGFEAKGLWWERILYHSISILVAAVALGIVGTWLFNRLKRRHVLGLDTHRLGLLMGLLVLVPGLLVNQGLKEHMGRARPVKLEKFGGKAGFTPAFAQSDQEGGSFSSGHAAAGFWLVAVAFCLSGRFGTWVAVALVYAVVISVLRIATGSHFLSDAIASAFFVWMGWLALSGLIGASGARGEDMA